MISKDHMRVIDDEGSWVIAVAVDENLTGETCGDPIHMTIYCIDSTNSADLSKKTCTTDVLLTMTDGSSRC